MHCPCSPTPWSGSGEGWHGGGQLLTERYEDLGGVRGALAQQADSALADAVTAAGRSPGQVISELLRLVTVDEQGRPTRWRVRRDELPAPVLADLQPFVVRRLPRRVARRGTPAVLVDCTEARLCPYALLCQATGGRLSTEQRPEDAYKPFDRRANGHVIGEGGAILLLEEPGAPRKRLAGTSACSG